MVLLMAHCQSTVTEHTLLNLSKGCWNFYANRKGDKIFAVFSFRRASHQLHHYVEVSIDFASSVGKPVRFIFVQKLLLFYLPSC